MKARLEHPETLGLFEAASSRRVRGWAGFCLGLWLVLLAGDWKARFTAFRWQDQWMPQQVSMAPGGARALQVPAQTGSGLTRMVPVPWVAARYAEFHSGYTVHRDASGHANEPFPDGTSYPIVMLGDSFLTSLGTQNVAQVLASVGGVAVYNHARPAAGPFLEMRKFIASHSFDPPPQIVVWNLTARELGVSLFARQAVDDWFDRAESKAVPGGAASGSGIRWDLVAPSELRKSFPNTSLMAYLGRQAWAQVRLVVFGEWPQDVLGAEDPQFGPMLFYRENLRVLPKLTPETDAPAVVRTVQQASRRFRERGMTLVVLLVPEKEQIYVRALSMMDQEALSRGPKMLATIESGLKDAGIPVVNLMPAFQEATEKGVRLYWRDDTHWNDAGIRLAAEELWKVIGPLLK